MRSISPKARFETAVRTGELLPFLRMSWEASCSVIFFMVVGLMNLVRGLFKKVCSGLNMVAPLLIMVAPLLAMVSSVVNMDSSVFDIDS